MKQRGEKITLLSLADYYSAKLVDEQGISCILIGDSLGRYLQGGDDNLAVTTWDMYYYTRIVRKAVTNAFLIADLPFSSYEAKDGKETVEQARSLMDAGAEAVKLEGADAYFGVVEELVKAGIPVVGHIGLRDTYLRKLGGFPATERDHHKDWDWILSNARSLHKLGVKALLLECVPAVLGEKIAKELPIPVIGRGAGSKVDGQALIFQEMMGYHEGFKPKFVKRYARLSQVMSGAVRAYVEETQSQRFPSDEHEI